MHGEGSGSLQETGWTLFQPGLPLRKRWQAGVGILVSRRLDAATFGVFLQWAEKAVSLYLRAKE